MKTISLAFLFYCFFPLAYCQTDSSRDETKPYFQQGVNYKIVVTLNDASKTLDGFESIDYTNNSPDTLTYIWFHVWPNAYKNDETAFSEQLLLNGRTDFYFSPVEKHGYINRLDFKADSVTVNIEDHPQYIDVIKLLLPATLPPGKTVKITTPFHEKIPFNFSRGGYVGHSYQITQWYPKPAVYDTRGWHPIPYLDQGEFYSEYGNFNVQIILPKDYIVAATGDLQNADEKNWLLQKASEERPMIPRHIISPAVSKQSPSKPKLSAHKKTTGNKKSIPVSKKNTKLLKPSVTAQNTVADLSKESATQETKTLLYIQNNVHDFAWFADKNFIVRHDTLSLASGKIIDAFAFFTPAGFPVWKNSISFIKDAVRTRSAWLGEYPYNVVTAVEAKMGFDGGMEYPTITSISPMHSEKDLDLTIEHEVGHNWNYGILGTNERTHPWMDEGMNTYFDNRYEALKYPGNNLAEKKNFFQQRIPDASTDLIYRAMVASKKDQPIETSSENFSALNYNIIAYYKTGKWMKELETYVGEPLFDSCLHEYYNRWKFKHPYPEDFKKVVEDVSNKNVDSVFLLLHSKGKIEPALKKDTRVLPFFSFKDTDKHSYIFVSPSVGYNYYDNFMAGILVHNYTLPEPDFHFFLAPMYATGSKSLTGIGKIGYNHLSYGLIRKVEISVSGEKFTGGQLTDSTGAKNKLGFTKLVPAVKIIFRNKNALSTLTKSIQWKTYFIQETGFLFTRDTVHQVDVISYPKANRYVNQLQLKAEDNRVLYPYSGTVLAEQASNFARLTFEGKYFFNYASGGGLDVRLFGGKFFYLGNSLVNNPAASQFTLNMTGANGYEDYTYSNYFAGRNEFDGFRSQQIMIRDGGFKVRSDLFANKIGKTDDWLVAANFTTGFPKQINPLQLLPFNIPLKLFLDVGTYAEAWKKDPPTGKFIYDAGLQVSVVKDMINLYIPVIYSKVYADYFKSTIPDKRFWKTISFSIDIQNFRFSKIFNQRDL